MRADVKSRCEDRPGVYRMTSADGEIVYVGKSKRVRTRLLSYFRCGPAEKGARIVRNAASIDWEYTPSEFAALLAELRLIKKLRPRLNVAMKRDARHFAFIKVTRGPASKLLVVRGAGDEAADVYYGPYYGAERVNEAVRELNDALGLRDCGSDRRMHFADQPELFEIAPRTPGCLRYEILQSPANPAQILIFEAYENEAAVQAHRAADHFKAYQAATKDLVVKR